MHPSCKALPRLCFRCRNLPSSPGLLSSCDQTTSVAAARRVLCLILTGVKIAAAYGRLLDSLHISCGVTRKRSRPFFDLAIAINSRNNRNISYCESKSLFTLGFSSNGATTLLRCFTTPALPRNSAPSCLQTNMFNHSKQSNAPRRRHTNIHTHIHTHTHMHKIIPITSFHKCITFESIISLKSTFTTNRFTIDFCCPFRRLRPNEFINKWHIAAPIQTSF